MKNTTFPSEWRTSFDQAPYSTSTSLLYLIVGILSDDEGGGVLLALLSASSTELHRAPTDSNRHNDWGIISPLLAWYALTGIEVFSKPHLRVLSLLVVYVVFWTTYQDMTVAIAIGGGLFLVRAAYLFWQKPLLRLTLLTSLLCGAAAITAKQYGDGNISWIQDHHHLSECTNDLNSDAIKDIVHALWHVFSALGLLIFEGKHDYPTSGLAATAVPALAVIIAACLNDDVYWGWLMVSFGSPIWWLAIDFLFSPTKKYSTLEW